MGHYVWWLLNTFYSNHNTGNFRFFWNYSWRCSHRKLVPFVKWWWLSDLNYNWFWQFIKIMVLGWSRCSSLVALLYSLGLGCRFHYSRSLRSLRTVQSMDSWSLLMAHNKRRIDSSVLLESLIHVRSQLGYNEFFHSRNLGILRC